MVSHIIYNTIGANYDLSRQADPQIVARLKQYLSLTQDRSYLDVGCGTGNYTDAIYYSNIELTGIDVSTEMLEKAKLKNNHIQWVCGDARKMPFSNNCFDGAMCILATHHIKDLDTAFKEIFRVMKRGNFVIFTSFPEQMRQYWLNHYLPKMMKKSELEMSSFQVMSDKLYKAGFENVRAEKFFVTNELKDLFLFAGKYRPEIYLNHQIRCGISSFALFEDQFEIDQGCKKLELDISSGYINEVIASYENDLGEYAFVICSKEHD